MRTTLRRMESDGEKPRVRQDLVRGKPGYLVRVGVATPALGWTNPRPSRTCSWPCCWPPWNRRTPPNCSLSRTCVTTRQEPATPITAPHGIAHCVCSTCCNSCRTHGGSRAKAHRPAVAGLPVPEVGFELADGKGQVCMEVEFA